MRISDWSSDVCSSDLSGRWTTGCPCLSRPWIPRERQAPATVSSRPPCPADGPRRPRPRLLFSGLSERRNPHSRKGVVVCDVQTPSSLHGAPGARSAFHRHGAWFRSEEHTSELQSLMRISYAVFCLKKKNSGHHTHHNLNRIDHYSSTY